MKKLLPYLIAGSLLVPGSSFGAPSDYPADEYEWKVVAENKVKCSDKNHCSYDIAMENIPGKYSELFSFLGTKKELDKLDREIDIGDCLNLEQGEVAVSGSTSIKDRGVFINFVYPSDVKGIRHGKKPS